MAGSEGRGAICVKSVKFCWDEIEGEGEGEVSFGESFGVSYMDRE